jgi:acyl-CoA reductase-like NAD-dependent aldehyde dehydrogenase
MKNLVSVNKYDGSLLGEVPFLTQDKVDSSLERASQIFKTNKTISREERSLKLELYARLIQSNHAQLSALLSAEAGKPITYAMAEVDRCVSTVLETAAEILRFDGDKISFDREASKGRTAFTQYHPIGPIFCIVPFNFPMNLTLHKIAPALALGNPVLVKPSPFTPISTLKICELAHSAGFSEDEVQFLNIDNEIAQTLVESEKVKMLSFTGSPLVGWKLKSLAGKKKVVLELGGNAPVIVEDAENINKVAAIIAKSAFLYSGQICISTQRVLVNKSIYSDFKIALIEESKKISTGDPLQSDTINGPLIDKLHVDRMKSIVADAKEKGANLLIGGNALAKNIFECSILEKTNINMKVESDEVFGPLVTLNSYDTFNDAIIMSNTGPYGLQVGVYTQNIKKMKQAQNELDFGAVLFNSPPGFRLDHMPYGGVKDSGFGREGILYSLKEMSELKLIIY